MISDIMILYKKNDLSEDSETAYMIYDITYSIFDDIIVYGKWSY